MIPRIIILEGPDGAGKSTLAKELLKHYKNSVYIHMTYRFKKRMFMYNTAVFRKIESNLAEGKTVILDRCWISENIYAAVFRPNSLNSWPLIGRYMERLFQKHSYVGIICKPWTDISEQVMRHKDLKDADHPYEDSQYAEVVLKYDRLSKLKNCGLDLNKTYLNVVSCSKERGIDEWPWINYDYRKDKVSQLVDAIDCLIERRDLEMYDLFNFDPNVTGNISNPKVLIIGDKTNYKTTKDLGYPFHEYGHSSLFLNKVLNDLGALESDLCFMNAEHLGKVQLDSVRRIVAAKLPLVVSLGQAASAVSTIACIKENANVPISVMHPSYAMRFKKEKAFKGGIHTALTIAGIETTGVEI